MRPVFVLLALPAVALAACGVEPPTIPESPVTRSAPDLRPQAFHVRLDLDAGTATVRPPGAAALASSDRLAPSLSLLGADAVEAYMTTSSPCVQVTKNPNVKRCAFELEVRNRFSSVDFMTPTDFPKPPQGTSGVLLFPFNATSDGTGGWALPSPDWDNGPANFFNDAAGCNNGGKSDCYRYELIAAPFYAGDTRIIPTVGFDVPGDARFVDAYVVMAANLRENPLQTSEIRPEDTLCGYASSSGYVLADSYYLETAVSDEHEQDGAGKRSFCSFKNFLPADARLFEATLRLFVVDFAAAFNAEPLDYGTSLDASDYWLPSPPPSEVAKSICCVDEWAVASVLTSVQQGVSATAPYFQYRIMPPDNYQNRTRFAGPAQSVYSPRLRIQWRWK
ncbi:MAG TPA: hypothetical protein VJT85_03535 [Gemmatimonadaceae bacterium]|nr:hypothetical protein [Gemmatimonadaceae bacterium]